jgi:hypothetical protein
VDGMQWGRGEPIKGLRGSWGGVPRGRPASNSAGIAACGCERREKALTRGPGRSVAGRGARAGESRSADKRGPHGSGANAALAC